jgi:phosphoribosylformimino-5-aminoimidazole carboxamide ribotide isomerase
MIIYPTIELKDGRCVSLNRGRFDEAQVWHVDPFKIALDYAKAGAEWLHITDFDAMDGSDRNADLIRKLILESGCSVQLGGGIRTQSQIDAWIEAGVSRIVLGTLAVQNPDLVKAAAKYNPDQIVLAVDVFNGKVTLNAWREQSAFEPDDFIAAFSEDPLAAVIVTDIDADIEDAENSLSLVARLAGLTRTPVIASGMVNSMDDLSRLIYVPHVSGVIIGRALLNRNVDLKTALALAVPEPGPVPELV